MSIEGTARIARRFVMEHNQAAYETSFAELLTPDVRVHEYLPGLPEPLDLAGYTQFIAGFRAALPDVRNEAEQVIVDGAFAAVRWIGHGTHTGEPLMGIPAKGTPVNAHGIYLLRFRDGKIAEVWNNWDNLNVAQQLGGA